MTNRLLKILAINPGSRYIGVAVFESPELKDWRIKIIKGKWSKEKSQKIKILVRSLVEQYQPDVLAIKQLHLSRSSAKLNRLVSQIRQFSKRKGLRIYQYSIKDLKDFFSPEGRISKKQLAGIVASKYPALLHEFIKEKTNKNPYHIRMFEAVALGAVCSCQLDKN